MTPTTPIRRLLGTLTALAVLAIVSCGGSASATIGGTLSGLGSGLSVVLQNDAADDLTLSANGSFEFATALSSLDTYSITVLTQPVGQTCTVANGSGTIDSSGDAVSNVAVTCTTTASLGGTVSGLTAGTSVTLSNGSATLAIASNGPFAFPGTLAAGSAYNVSVATQPVGLTCSVTNGSGTVVANTMASVLVTCS